MNEAMASRDTGDRTAALDTTRSFIVQAPAGSGKTELLIQRYLALLARVERPESIVAMTFTRKAAGEIRQRILVALRDAGQEQPIEPHRATTRRLAQGVLERDAVLGWNLVAHPARLQLHTIDALCMALMRQAPLTAKLGALPRPTEHAEALHAEAALAELDDAGAHAESWRRLLEHVDNDADRLVRRIADMLGKREQWLRHLVADDRAALRVALEQTLAAEIEAVLSALDALLTGKARARLADLAQHAARSLAETKPEHPLAPYSDRAALPSANAHGLAHWQAIARWLLTGKGELLRQVDIRHGFAPKGNRREAGHAERDERKQAMLALMYELESIPGFAAALDAVRTLPPPRYDDAAWSFIEALLDVLPRAAARLPLVFAQHGVIDFNEATLVALRALQGEEGASDLLLSLDARIEHLLVDEFQDTSLAQCDLVESLTTGWSEGDGRTLFVVGDAMQSIYRFRDANVSLFLEAQRNRRVGSVAVEPLTLSRNFRAQRALVEWVNETFPEVLPPRDEPARGAVAFKPSQAAREDRFEPPTFELAVDAAGEAEIVVTRIQMALASNAQSIAVLVRKRTDLAQILPALRAAGINFTAVELDRLSERQAMLDLVALTHALIQPDDRAAWLAVLRAPWCALSLSDLFAVVEACGKESLAGAVCGPLAETVISRLSIAGRIGFERLTAAVAPALANRGRTPLATMVRGAWLALGGPACVAEPIDLVAVDRVFALIAEHAIGADVPDWPAFCGALEALHAEPEIDAATRVQLMTLHRAKGLEFDVVVMPGLARDPGSSESQLLLWKERPAGLLLAPIRARAKVEGDPIYGYLRSLAADEDDAELRRVLYVGCTRARRSLHLTAALDVERDEDGNPQWKAPARKTLLEALWAVLKRPPPPVPAARTPAISPQAEAGVPLCRLPPTWRPPTPPASVPLAQAPPTRSEREVIEFDWVRETARQIGVVAHRLLRRMAEDGLERWTRERAGAERARVERELAALGFTGAEAGTAVEQVLAAIENTLGDPRGRWLFDSRHLDARSEYALTEWRDGAFLHRVLDRTFVDTDGIRWIVDFKLSRHEGTDLEAFLDRECERYRAQLESYAAAMGALDGRPIRLALYFPLLAGWREWPAPMRA